MVFAGAPFCGYPSFLNFTIASLPGAVMWLGALPVWLGTIYVICCRHLYAIMHEWRVRSLFMKHHNESVIYCASLTLNSLSSEQVLFIRFRLIEELLF